MGFALIIGVIALGAAAYFGLLSGLANALMAFANSKTARFSRSAPTESETIYHVTPARPSRGALIAVGIGLLLIYQFPGFWIVGLIPLLIGLMVLPVGGRYRKSATIRVAGDVLVSGRHNWPLTDIVSLNVRAGSAFNTDDPGQAVYTTPGAGLVQGGKPTSVLFMKALARRVVERSYLVTLRTRQGSKEHVLAGGLNRDCAGSLADDLASDIVARGFARPARA
jgi:hypothetical protein